MAEIEGNTLGQKLNRTTKRIQESAAAAAEGIKKGAVATGGLLGNTYLHMAIIVAGFGMLTASVATMTKFAGDKDNWTALKPQLSTVLGLSLGGALALLLGAALYFTADDDYTVIFSVALSCFAIAISVAAVNVAVITR